MKKYNRVLLVAVIMISVILVYITVFAAPGTNDDPLVSKSYVDERINNVITILNNSGLNNSGAVTDQAYTKDEIVSQVMSELNILLADGTDSTVTTNASSYKPVKGEKGNVIIGDEGTEIILRSGSAVCFSQSENGLVNATQGVELMNGAVIPKNNILIVPRSDGRGVKVESEAWFIIRGGYYIVN